jgi:ubiquinone/menaquinone biosynthesis C-methylase UbiE
MQLARGVWLKFEGVLDIGVGDVAMLAARLTGPTGEVVGIERDATTLTVARSRIERAGFPDVRFLEGDIGLVPSSEPFDAVVGRLILEQAEQPDRLKVFKHQFNVVGVIFYLCIGAWSASP